MKLRTKLRVFCALFIVIFVSIEQSQAQNSAIPWSSFNMGSGSSASGNTSVVSASGESFVGTSQAGDSKILSGFLANMLSAGVASVSVDVESGWNMVAVPNHVVDPRKTVLFPQAISNAFEFDAGYFAAESLQLGRGYWLKFSGPNSISIFGAPAVAETIAIGEGWNLIGGISSPVTAASVALAATINRRTCRRCGTPPARESR